MNIVKLQNGHIPGNSVQTIIEILDKGGFVVLPTDTSYMLAVDSLNNAAVQDLYALKKRLFNQPVSVCCSDIVMANQHARFSLLAARIAEKFLPGPLTIVLPAVSKFPKMLMKNNKIGIRIPAAPVTLEIVRAFGKPLTATSANKSGGKEPYLVSTVIEELGDDKIEFVINADPLNPGPVSTIAEIEQDSIKILREGPIPESVLKKIIREI
ncbi:MAG: threonylcarbamoyl-AMP synthase [Candidatus Schekmanbacteria bacterium RBG_13_48_7]|uniref:L-threonylcarbamoyladenylate synthase n=1 Tax=Candidatus Schekmanbacteria bacterium RBG_13_48_7 TaxID=1817878 RepID=A0A1F7S2C2_9BACT|nr:MAG: threonylcarbamoyl-AMP synthase [Candidatus Schekmanbacteria bacterium RBG_13_48_7]